MNCKRNLFAAALLLGGVAASGAAVAQQAGRQPAALFSYQYLQFAFVDLDSDFDGIRLDGSFDLSNDLALTAAYMATDNDSRIDYDLLGLGVAYHQRLANIPRSDLVLHGEFQRGEVEVRRNPYFDHDDTGLRLGAMIRHQAQQNLEVFGDLSYTSLFDNDLALTAGVNLALNRQFSFVGSIELSDDDMLLLGVRLNLK